MPNSLGAFARTGRLETDSPPDAASTLKARARKLHTSQACLTQTVVADRIPLEVPTSNHLVRNLSLSLDDEMHTKHCFDHHSCLLQVQYAVC